MSIPTDVITRAPTSRAACEAWYWNFLTDAQAAAGNAGYREAKRVLMRGDLYYLLRYACGREDLARDWLFDRCREVQFEPEEWLDLWARDHYKSTIITFGLTILDILNDPDITSCIFSHTGDIAKAFLVQIKRELENNSELKDHFPEILFRDPQVESPKWSEDEGIVVKRKSNPKEPTVMASGLVDGMPTGMHFKRRIYDDVVVPASVSGPEMIQKTTAMWQLSDNLGTRGGTARYIGTRYARYDTYHDIMEAGIRTRIHPATENGKEDGKPVLLSVEELKLKRRKQGLYNFNAQMLLNPTADKKKGFKHEWLAYHNVSKALAMELNRYIIVDPASSKKKTSDYTVMMCIGIDALEHYYILDVIRDRLNLSERADAMFALHRAWRPLKVGYEKYGVQADVEYIEERQRLKNYRFEIVELGGRVRKEDRILGLVPYFEQGRILLPEGGIIRTDWEGNARNLVTDFIKEEYEPFPVVPHDDMLDTLARILDPALELEFPDPEVTASQSWRDTRLQNTFNGGQILDFLTR